MSRRIITPTYPTFRNDSSLVVPSIANLDEDIVCNGLTGTNVFRYKGGDANILTWPAWTYGETLGIASTGTDPTFNAGSPLFGTHDDSVLYNGGEVHQASNAAFADVTTEDLCIEYLLKTPATTVSATQYAAGKDTHNLLVSSFTQQFAGFFQGPGGTYQARYNSVISYNTWYFIQIFWDPSETNEAHGAQIYVNGLNNTVFAKTATNPSTVGSLTSANKFTIGATVLLAGKWLGSIAYLQMAKRANWFAGGAQNLTDWAALHNKRFAQIQATYPQIFKGTALPTFTRSTPAFSRKTDALGNVTYHQMGLGWARSSKLLDGDGAEFTGLDIEPSGTNYSAYSLELNNWGMTNGTTPASIASPFNGKLAYNFVESIDVGNTLHSISSSGIAHGDLNNQNVISMIIVAPGDRPYIRWISRIGNTSVITLFADASTGAVSRISGTTLSSSGYTPLGTFGGKEWKLIWARFVNTAGAGNSSTFIYSSTDASVVSYIGTGTICWYLAYAGIAIGENELSSPIITTTASVTRAADSFYWKADDGNLGAVGSDKQGTICFDILCPAVPSANRNIMELNDGGAVTDAALVYINTSGHIVMTLNAVGGTTRTITGPAVSVGDNKRHRVRIAYRAGRAVVMVDGSYGTFVDSVVAADIPDDLDRINPIGGGLITNLRFVRRPIWSSSLYIQ